MAVFALWVGRMVGTCSCLGRGGIVAGVTCTVGAVRPYREGVTAGIGTVGVVAVDVAGLAALGPCAWEGPAAVC